MNGGELIKLFTSIVLPIYKIVLIAAAALVPLIIIRVLVARSTTNAEELSESRELSKAGLNIALVFILLPPIITLLMMAISSAFSGASAGFGDGKAMNLVALQGTGASSIYSIIFGVLTWLAIAFASMARTTFTYSLVPSIGIMEETTFFNAASQGGVGNAINSFWIFFMGLAVAIIIILVLVDYFKDVFALASGQSVSRPELGGGIFTILARVITSILMAAFSWPISRAIIFLGEQLYNIFIKVIGEGGSIYGNIDISTLSDGTNSQMDYLAGFINNKHPIAAGSAIYALTPWSDKMATVISGVAGPVGMGGVTDTSTVFSIASLPQALIILFLSTYSTMMIVTITAMMAMRYIMLAFLVIVSPVVFSGLASKFTEKGFSKWLNKMITWSVFPVIVAMVLLFGYFLANGMGAAFEPSVAAGVADPTLAAIKGRSIYFIKMFIYAAAMLLVTKCPALISDLTSGLTEGMEEPNAIISSITKRH